jgi:predicted methyltransferase
MRRTIVMTLLTGLVLMAGCSDDAVTIPASSAPPQAATGARGLAARLSLAMAAPERPIADKELDATRKPLGVLDFIGITDGMRVLDVNAAGGYYTELLAAAVGPSGVVYAQNDVAALESQEGQLRKELDARLANDRLPNVFRLDEDLDNLALEQEFDAAMLVLTLHDLYNFRGEATTIDLLRRIHAALKPGAVLGVVDHVGEASRALDARMLHRIEQDTAERLLEAAGFTIEDESDLLANPADPHDRSVFDESIRRRTDRFVLRARA